MESNHTEELATKVLSSIRARIRQSNLTVIPFAAISLPQLAVLSLGLFAPSPNANQILINSLIHKRGYILALG